MSEEITHPHYEQFLQHQEAAEQERAEAFKDFKTGIEQLAAEGRLEEQFSAEDAETILAELGEVEVPTDTFDTTEGTEIADPDGAIPSGDETAEPEATADPVAQVDVTLTTEEIQADLEHGTDDAPAEEPSEEPAEETPAEEPEAKEEPVEERPAPKKRTTKAKAKKTEE